MKRNCLFIFFTFVLLPNVFAQKISEGTLKPLKTIGETKVVLDFSQASIHGMSVNEFAVYEQDWEVDKPIIIAKFLSGLVEKCSSIRFGTERNTELTLIVKVLSISTKGNYNCEVVVTNSHGEILSHIIGLKAIGGTFGSKLNLIKDGAEHTGEALGKFINRMIRD